MKPSTERLLGPQPRYLQLAQTLVREIEEGVYSVGSLLPNEFALCEQFGASRFTVRSAVKQLVDLGLVVRQPGIGTRVQRAAPDHGYRQAVADIADLNQYASDTQLDILHRDTVRIGKTEESSLDLPEGEVWLHLRALRRTETGREPISLADVYVAPAYRTLRQPEGRLRAPIYTLLEQQFGERVARVEQLITAIALPNESARLLAEKPRSPALKIVRRYFNQKDDLLELAVNLHPADRFSYHAVFRRDVHVLKP